MLVASLAIALLLGAALAGFVANLGLTGSALSGGAGRGGGPSLELRSASNTSGNCTGARLPSDNLSGRLVRVGLSSPLPPVSGVSLEADYEYEVVFHNSSGSTTTCAAGSITFSTSGAGGFALTFPIPTDRCVPDGCLQYYGPFAPIHVFPNSTPVGWFLSTDWTAPTVVDLTWWAELASVALSPSGTAVVSVGAPRAVHADARSADGSSALGSLSFGWTLRGLGWGMVENGPGNVTVESSDTWTGNLSVQVAADYSGTREWANSTALALVPVATRLSTIRADPAFADEGVPVNLTLQGEGAGGYPYFATFEPGAGLPPVSGVCAETPLPNGSATIACRATVRYAGNGSAAVSAVLSNGYSSAVGSGPDETVNVTVRLALVPERSPAFPREPVPFLLERLPGTGTSPFRSPCVTSPASGSFCLTGPGPVWRFVQVFPEPGTYDLLANESDSFGLEGGVRTSVLVVPPLAVAPVGSSQLKATLGAPLNLSVRITGGAPSLAYWWNLSAPRIVMAAGSLPFDGVLSEEWTPSALGLSEITVVARDRLGEQAAVAFRVNVSLPLAGRGPAAPGPSALSALAAGAPYLVFALGAGGALLALGIGRRRRRARRSPTEDGPAREVSDAELVRLAEGREHLLARAPRDRAATREELTAGWSAGPVHPAEWTDWITSLVAEGALRPEYRPDGRVGYKRAPAAPRPPTIQFDAAIFDAAKSSVPRASPEAEGGGAAGRLPDEP
jgi:hypothetical protein